MHYVYILKNSKSKRLYIGYTANIPKSVRGHNSGDTKSTHTANGIWHLVYYEAFLSKNDATQREWNLKHQGRQRDFLKKNIQDSLQAAIV